MESELVRAAVVQPALPASGSRSKRIKRGSRVLDKLSHTDGGQLEVCEAPSLKPATASSQTQQETNTGHTDMFF